MGPPLRERFTSRVRGERVFLLAFMTINDQQLLKPPPPDSFPVSACLPSPASPRAEETLAVTTSLAPLLSYPFLLGDSLISFLLAIGSCIRGFGPSNRCCLILPGLSPHVLMVICVAVRVFVLISFLPFFCIVFSGSRSY